MSATDAILALDTATRLASVAVRAGGRVVAERSAHSSTHSERLLVLIDETLREAGLAPDDLAAVACGAGPGSFTGLRIGLATAKGLCFATGARLLLVPSLAALALDGLAGLAPEAPAGLAPDPVIVPLLDARRYEVFAGFYAREGSGVRELAPDVVLPPEALAATLRAHGLRAAVVLGDALGVYRERLFAADPALPLRDDLSAAPRAASVAALAAARLAAGESDDLARAEPRYLRGPDALLPGEGKGGSFTPDALTRPAARRTRKRVARRR